MYEIEDENGYKRTVHPAGDFEVGYDLTKFYGRDRFRELLDQHELELSEVGEGDEKHFVWHGEDVLIVTKANPLTGEHPMRDRKEPAYASYIGIEGKRDAVAGVAAFIRKNADWKDRTLMRREYI